ncbi:MAG: phosphoglucosamine mutase [Myxococcota bacterium]|nr:phosphoglucosamine mutase [Deltaproteobacteria bacterium]MCP4239510.1 phosphoglucosamine mutase [bacterium]MDP6073646.1 phosphoglucosamine mutase [Myxococcota bacterium]MDP6242037.1 phosphoglucosamine mutase [Myxococcota bacterium]MDP7074180.1 phosphoglucosamine mutase [Myxococcota bacterium]
MRDRLFGTDGVRGRANEHPMTAEVALALGQAIAHVLRVPGAERRRIIIGKDTRLSGYVFEDALAAGICTMGVDVIQVGPMPTPGMAFLTQDMRCHAGVMISASHNAYEDNGIKFFSSDGFKLPDAIETRIESLIASGELATLRAPANEIGQARRIDDAEGRYVVFLKKTLPPGFSLEGLRVVLDCANGAGYKVGPTVLAELGAEVFALGVEPNGRNINNGCGALFPERTVAKVREVRADVGIALDGDADRAVLVDEQGEILDGDELLALFTRDLIERGALRGDQVVGTVMSNLGLEHALTAMGTQLLRTSVGDRYVVEAMRKEGCNLGGEQSGHLVFLDHNTTGDALVTALQALAIMRRKGGRLSELAEAFERFPQTLVSVPIAAKRPIEELPKVMEALERIEAEFEGRGRVVIRYSGTEPKARIMVEGDDASRVSEVAAELADELRYALAEG